METSKELNNTQAINYNLNIAEKIYNEIENDMIIRDLVNIE